MERLTVRWTNKVYDTFDPVDVVNNEYSKINYNKILTKLGEYEDLEEQGLLLRLPCKVGDIVYVNDILGCGEVERYKVIRVDYHSTLGTGRNEFYIEALLCTNPDKSIAFYDKQFGKTVFGKTIFLTKSEAEARLKELRGVKWQLVSFSKRNIQ